MTRRKRFEDIGRSFIGRWRIVDMDEWAADYRDLVVPAHVTVDKDGSGDFQFGTVRGWLDSRVEVVGEETRLEFSWEGRSDSDPGCGRGWAVRQGDELRGHLFIHTSDDSAFLARLEPISSGIKKLRRLRRRQGKSREPIRVRRSR